MQTARRLRIGLAMAALLAGGAALADAPKGKSAQETPKRATHVAAERADYKEVVPGVSKDVLWGNDEKGPYAAFTKFKPGLTNALHTHTNDIRIVVLKGAYIYQPEKGPEVRVGAGEFLIVPAGVRHVSSGDPKEGALFYEESTGKWDIKFVTPPPRS